MDNGVKLVVLRCFASSIPYRSLHGLLLLYFWRMVNGEGITLETSFPLLWKSMLRGLLDLPACHLNDLQYFPARNLLFVQLCADAGPRQHHLQPDRWDSLLLDPGTPDKATPRMDCASICLARRVAAPRV